MRPFAEGERYRAVCKSVNSLFMGFAEDFRGFFHPCPAQISARTGAPPRPVVDGAAQRTTAPKADVEPEARAAGVASNAPRLVRAEGAGYAVLLAARLSRFGSPAPHKESDGQPPCQRSPLRIQTLLSRARWSWVRLTQRTATGAPFRA